MDRLREDIAMSKDCERFESSLLELAYGELSELPAEELRMHAAGCSRCRTALEEVLLTRKLAAQLPMIELGDDLDSKILDATADAASKFSREQPATRAIGQNLSAISENKMPGVLERLRSFLLTPALATAAVAALIFVITFFLAQKGTNRDERLKMEANAPLVGRPEPFKSPVRENETKETYQTPAPAQPELLVAEEKSIIAPAQTPDSTAGNLGTAGSQPKRRSKDKADSISSPARNASKSKKQKKALNILGDDEYFSNESNFRRSPTAPKAKEVHDDSFRKRNQAKPLLKNDSDYRLGMAAYARGDCDTATTALTRVVNQGQQNPSRVPYAMHHIARCEKRRGRFGKALPWYDKLLTRFPGYPNRPGALLEASQCHRRLGHIRRARARLVELSQMPDWEARAEQEIERLAE
ncbi:MAG: hypothetical protein GY847_41205 [Proteobacteria bacterium]|nr:hypothetical protein [Pseudomonadota bacterium]